MHNLTKINIKSKSFRSSLCIISLIIASFFIYFNSLSGDFIIDDIIRIQNNEQIHNIGNYFSNHFKWGVGSFQEATLALIWHFSGGSPFGFHLYNVLLHTICVILVYVLCLMVFKDKPLAFLTSLIFAIHPIHTEAVSWISGNPYLISSLFNLAIFILYLKTRESTKCYLLCGGLFFVGLLFAKEVFVAPFMIVVYELSFGSKRIFIRKDKWFILLLSSVVLVLSLIILISVYISRSAYSRMIFQYRGWSYLIVALKAFAYYLKILYLPLARGLYHPFAFTTVNIQEISPLFFISIAIISLLIFSFFRFRKKFIPISFGLMWFFIAYLPYSNFIPICNIISERYLYLSSVGVCIILAALFLKSWKIINKDSKQKTFLRYCAVAVVTLFLSSYATLTLRRNYDYNNVITYWWSNINNFKDGYIVYNNLARTFYTMGDLNNALVYCYTNLMVNSNQPYVWCNLGKIYCDLKDFDEAAYCYNQALEIDKNYLPAIKSLEKIKAQ